MELFEQIRREYEHGGGTIRGIAKKLGIHRRMVREAVLSAVPAERKVPVRERPKLEPARAFVDAILEADQKAPRKQRHTAHRIWCRIRAEMLEVVVAESTIRRYVRERKIKLGLTQRETFIPQSYSWGAEAQVDWYEAHADMRGERQKVYLFCMRSMASGGAFHRAFPHASQQAFLEAHELAFAYFGGVFTTLRYDNLKSAVKKILRGYQREETTRFIAFRSHWGFTSEFCTPGEGHEKGGVEGEGGYFRRNHLVPVPQVASWEELNTQLLEASKKDEQRIIGGRTQTVGAGMQIEREHLRRLAPEGFDLAGIHFPQVNASGCARVLTNFYSVPLPVGVEVQAKVYSAYVEIWHQGERVARHERCFDRQQKVLDLEHYLEALTKKPGALVRNLAEGGYLSRSEPIIFLGEAGTGKTHLAIGLGVAACRQRKRVRFTTAAQLVNELIEAKNKSELNRVTNRWTRYDLLVIDEMAYVAMPEAAAEMMFQIIAGRAERAAVMVTTNLPFSEWTTMFPNARLCKAMLDRLTDQAHIIETGNESYRFRRTLEKKGGSK